MQFKETNILIYIAFTIHIALTLLLGLKDDLLLTIMAIPLAGNAIGLYFLSFTDKIKIGAKIFIISSALFVPIGMIGVIGARKVIDHLTEQEFLKTKTDDKRI